jgi:hypothetical protein
VVQVYIVCLSYINLWLTRVGFITLIWSFQVIGNSHSKLFPHFEGLFLETPIHPPLGDILVLSSGIKAGTHQKLNRRE